MLRGICLLLIISLLNINMVSANNDTPPPLEKFYSDFGFKHVEEALNTCASHFNKELKLPYKLPQLSFTHQLGKCDKKNNVFEVMFINEDSPRIHYKVRVRPVEHKVSF